mgnify:CR=1 FL=1|tara:strand:- start:5171 stop:5698 length:528 start_codon:yes stop_codon:yes gene_type:complete
MDHAVPELPCGEVAGLHKRDGPLLVVSTRSEAGFGLVAFDDRSPTVMMRAGRDFWRDIYSHAGAGRQHGLRATALAVRGSKVALMTEGGSLIAGDVQKSCGSMPCEGLDPNVLDFVDDSGFVVFDPARCAIRVYDVEPRAPSLRREIKLRNHPRVIMCSNGKVRVECGDAETLLF